ncbi:MAG: hypothetical protein Tsb0034_00790 [Ekhidna sp.]
MNEQSNGNKKGIIIVIVMVVLGALVAAWYWGMFKPEQEAKERARLAQIAKEQAEQKRKEEEAQKRARYDQLIVDADAAFEQEDWSAAQARYSEALSLFSNETYPSNQLELVNAKLDEIAEREARRAAGVIETVSNPTGRFYVIVSSSIDDDLAMDYARKLSNEGRDVKLVQHNANELPFHGVSVGDYDTWDQANAAAGSMADFGGAWVLKY